jgi:hypothetical protein
MSVVVVVVMSVIVNVEKQVVDIVVLCRQGWSRDVHV